MFRKEKLKEIWNQISLDEGKVLFIRDFSIKYDKETEEVEELNLTAYLFQ